ncbi:MAG: hypothetical protein OEV91_04780, partial [Desulfobulbaceae bacterium]|nr:hypothetical protein [Desulfobulbaceae bacterium]
IILKHHERLTGGGYPAGITGEEIGLLPRIVAVADTYEALVAERPYKKALSSAEAMAILEREAAAGRLDGKMVKALAECRDRLAMPAPPPTITAGFMKDIELFRARAYFREPLSDFYNYRYLLFLDDAGVLSNKTLPCQLALVGFPGFGLFQDEVSHLVADQVFDEIGQNLLDSCQAQSRPRERYDGSMMLFRMGIDYLIYLELEGGDEPDGLLAPVLAHLGRTEREWGLTACLHRVRCEPGQPLVKGLRQLFVHARAATTGGEG